MVGPANPELSIGKQGRRLSISRSSFYDRAGFNLRLPSANKKRRSNVRQRRPPGNVSLVRPGFHLAECDLDRTQQPLYFS